MSWMRDVGTPCSASDVAPPAHMEWPPTELLKYCLIHDMKKYQVGTLPLEVSQSGDRRGNSESQLMR